MDEEQRSVEVEVPKPDPARRRMPARTKVLLGLLGLMCVTFGVNAAHVYALENELREIAEEKARKEHERAKRLGVPIDTAYIVTATKEYLIYGDVRGKIEVFVKQEGREDRIVGMDYFMTRDQGDWTVLDSSACTDETCQRRGTEAFAAN
jgi:hypothetical protein